MLLDQGQGCPSWSLFLSFPPTGAPPRAAPGQHRWSGLILSGRLTAIVFLSFSLSHR